MTPELVEEVITEYEYLLDNMEHLSDELEHVKRMLPRMRGFLKEGRVEKSMRWLGFIQGVFWMQSVYSLEELKSHNRANKNDE